MLALAWVVSATWAWKAIEATLGLPKVPDLLASEFDDAPVTGPMLTVVVPALNEAANVGACLESLMAQEYESMRVVAVDDRSTDGTGRVMDEIATRYPDRMQVLHVAELPEGWLGKTHAMTLAAADDTSEYLLFTDADVVFRADALRRSMAFAVKSGADHMVTIPTLEMRRWDERALLGFFQVCSLWAARPWKVADAGSKRDAVGVGAFNLMRREAYEQVGGFGALRMEIIEDMRMARRVKQAGLAQRVAFGKGLVNVHWASGAMGVVGVLTKNMFSAFGFRIAVLLGACVWLMGFCVLPVAGFFVRGMVAPACVWAVAMAIAYRAIGRFGGVRAGYVLLSPAGAVLLIYALLRSMATTLMQGGVVWRGTFYPLKELRKSAAKLW